MVLSHPCSLLNADIDKEPYLEYIICGAIENVDGNASFGKNPRLLHVELPEFEGLKLTLDQRKRGFIGKGDIATEQPLLGGLAIENESLIIRWMANRYTTTALPDEFENRVAKQKSKLAKAFASVIGSVCKAVYISLNEFILDLNKEDEYTCVLFFLINEASYMEYVDEEERKETPYADFIGRIETIFENTAGVTLKNAMFISENKLTVGQFESNKLKRWQFDYISIAKGGELI